MNNQKITNIVLGVMLSIISFFLVKTYSRIDLIESKEIKDSQEIMLLDQKFDFTNKRLEEKIDDLKFAIIELTTEIKTRKEKSK